MEQRSRALEGLVTVAPENRKPENRKPENRKPDQFWNGKRVFLTGHTGFKGSWLALWLQHLGADLTGYALDPPTDPSLFQKADVAACMHSVIGDLRDRSRLTSSMQSAEPEVVFHLAAQPLVRHSYADPVGTYETNVLGTIHVLEAVRQTPSVRAVVVITTDKCYENKEWIWPYRETDPLGGYDPYSSSKACAEIVTALFARVLLQPRAATPNITSRSHPPAPAMSSAVATGPPIASSPISCAPSPAAGRSRFAIPQPPARGSMCSNPSAAISRSQKSSIPTAHVSHPPGTSALATPTPSRSSGSCAISPPGGEARPSGQSTRTSMCTKRRC